ncbi:MAG TPA: (d)CMP kinase [Candidatus Hydrogenedentes bacterium]|nr:(d)CMP kinase [Candidatus Hydrogenedentota bacterium]
MRRSHLRSNVPWGGREPVHETTQIIAIDGPAGAGKSTVARRAAEALGYAFLDTGAMYRAATWRALRLGVNLDDPAALEACAREMQLDMQETEEGLKVFVDGQDVTQAIRSPEVTRAIYKLDQNSGVRRHLVALQRQFGQRGPAVAEGRDIGTVVFPKARCKIYLDASLAARTERRAKELETRGLPVDREKLCAEIHERDEQSRNRADSPLRRAEDAVLLDTTDLTPDEVVARIVQLAREKLL